MAKKHPPRGEGLSHSPADERQLPFESHVVAFGRQRLADGVRSVPRVTSGSQKTGCPNRGLALGLGPAWPAPGGGGRCGAHRGHGASRAEQETTYV